MCRNAAWTLGKLGVSEAIEDLKALLEHKESEVRLSAAEALVKLGVRETIEYLRGALLYDQDPDVRSMAANVLGKLGIRETIEDLRRALLKDKDLVVRHAAVKALSNLGAHETIEDLKALLKDEVSWAPQIVAQALTRLDPHWNAELVSQGQNLLKIIDEELSRKISDSRVRLAAMEALKKIDSNYPLVFKTYEPAVFNELNNKFAPPSLYQVFSTDSKNPIDGFLFPLRGLHGGQHLFSTGEVWDVKSIEGNQITLTNGQKISKGELVSMIKGEKAFRTAEGKSGMVHLKPGDKVVFLPEVKGGSGKPPFSSGPKNTNTDISRMRVQKALAEEDIPIDEDRFQDLEEDAVKTLLDKFDDPSTGGDKIQSNNPRRS